MTPTLSSRDQQTVWHPFTQHKTAAAPIPIVRGAGSYLYDADGAAYLDAISSWWTNLHGHAHPYLAEALYKQAQQLEHVIFADFTHEPAVRLAERLLQTLPYLHKVFYSDNGSTAVEVALKMALQYWYNKGVARTKIIVLENAYHGDTFGAMSVGARGVFNRPFEGLFFDVVTIAVPYGDADWAIDESVFTDAAACIVEPLLQGSGGMLMYSAANLERLFACCKSTQTLIIADEVMTGFYRTGQMWATDRLTLKPDIICMSKGITGGMLPLGATACTDEIFAAFLSDDRLKTFFHGHSYTANPLSCAVANASLDLLQAPDCQANIQAIVAAQTVFVSELQGTKRAQNVRQCGTVVALEVSTDEAASYFNTLRDRIWQHFLQQKIILRPLGNTIYIMPPYCITPDELRRVHSAILSFVG